MRTSTQFTPLEIEKALSAGRLQSERCGACTVLPGAKAIKFCKVLISEATLGAITTLEGRGTAEELHPVQRAFLEEPAAQCGYCANGMIMTTAAFLLWPIPSVSI